MKFANRLEETFSKVVKVLEEQKNEEEHDNSGFDDLGEDFIVSGNITHKLRKDNEILDDLKDSLNIADRNVQEVQVRLDDKPFLDFILANNEFDREELLRLKKKIAGMKSTETKKNLNYLKEHEKEFQEILYKEKEKVPNTNELQKVMQNIADNLSFD